MRTPSCLQLPCSGGAHREWRIFITFSCSCLGDTQARRIPSANPRLPQLAHNMYGPAKHTWDADLMVQEGCNAAGVASGGSDVQGGGAA